MFALITVCILSGFREILTSQANGIKRSKLARYHLKVGQELLVFPTSSLAVTAPVLDLGVLEEDMGENKNESMQDAGNVQTYKYVQVAVVLQI